MREVLITDALCRSGQRGCSSAETDKANVSTGVSFLQKPQVFLFVFLGKSLQVAIQRTPNLPNHLQQKAGDESTPAGA